MKNFYDFKLNTIDGAPDLLAGLKGKVVLAVNVASQCGLTPQYTDLEGLHEELAGEDFAVVGFLQPVRCAGAGQRRGNPDVLLDELRRHVPDEREARGERRRAPPRSTPGSPTLQNGHAGDIQWNFEKF